MKKMDSVKLQRDMRDKAFRRHKGKSLAQEVEAVQKDLKKKGLDRWLERDVKMGEKERRQHSTNS